VRRVHATGCGPELRDLRGKDPSRNSKNRKRAKFAKRMAKEIRRLHWNWNLRNSSHEKPWEASADEKYNALPAAPAMLLGLSEPLSLDLFPVVVADGVVEGAGEVLHLGGGLYGGGVVRDRCPFGFGVHAHLFGWDGASVYDHVFQDVTDGVVDGVFHPPDSGAGGVEDLVALHLRERVVRAVVFVVHGSPFGGGGWSMCV